MPVPEREAASSGVRLSELVAVLSLSADLGLGQPMEHVLRSCLIAVRFGERVGLSVDQLSTAYWVTLLGMVCTSESAPLVKMFGDDIAFRSAAYEVKPTPLAELAFLVGRAGQGGSAVHRVRTAAGLLLTRGKELEASLAAHCHITGEVARRLGLAPDVSAALQHTFARWDGRGVPHGVAGSAIAKPAQLLQLADGVEVHHRIRGVSGALQVVQRNAGRQFDPGLVVAFSRSGAEILDSVGGETTWDDLIAAEPQSRGVLTDAEFDDALEVLADISDLKSPWFGGHSRGVAALATAAAAASGLSQRDITTLRRAALLHDIGRTGVPNSLWDKPAPLSTSEIERVRLHAYYTERMLRRPPALAGLATIASAGHERMDGSGYHRSISGSGLPILGRYLAAADAYHAMREERPYRPALAAAQAAAELRKEVRTGGLDAAAADAVLTAAGHFGSRRVSAPAGLTPRELEVLIVVARGATTRQVARRLGITPKTAGNHIERIYSKISVSSRSAATLYAMQHGMLQTLEPL